MGKFVGGSVGGKGLGSEAMKITSRAEKRNLIFLKGDWGQFDALHCSKFLVGRMACGRGEERDRING